MSTEPAAGANGFETPPWWQTCRQALTSGSTKTIILHLNTRDYAIPGKHMTTYLCRLLANRDVVAIYNRSTGLRFALPSMEEKARALLDTAGGGRPAPNPALAALGLAPDQQAESWPTQPGPALQLLERLMLSDASVTVIVEYAETLLPAADLAAMGPEERTLLVTLLRWGTDPQIQASASFALFLVQNLTDLHPALRAGSSGYYAVEVPLPDRAARLRFVEWYGAVKPLPSDLGPEELANVTAGLSLIHIENVLLQAELAGRLTRDLVRQHKAQLIRQEYAGLLEMLDPTYGFDAIGGMEQLKAWAQREIIAPVRENRPADMAQGVILVGPPGTGKTFFAKGLAAEIGFNAVALNMQNILGGIVGQSERNLARALAVVRSLAPVLVFMDELDQSDVSARGNASGNPVAKNLFNQLLQFLGDGSNRGRVVFCGASNRPDLLDDALKRSGRIDALIPVLLPEEPERAAIAQAAAAAQGAELDPAVAALIAARTDRYSAADLAAIVSKARKRARAAGANALRAEDALAALASLRPATPQTADFFTMLAVQACNDTDLLPARYAALLDDRANLARQIQDQAPAGRRKVDL